MQRFFDVHREEGYRVLQDAEGPNQTHMVAIIQFLEEVLASVTPVRLLTHCHAGASRSTATAYISLALRHGPGPGDYSNRTRRKAKGLPFGRLTARRSGKPSVTPGPGE